MKEPESMDECIYFTNRTLENDGSIRAWVYKKDCPECNKDKMGKPIKDGKVKIRATEYVCQGCGYTEQKTEHEESLTVDIIYKCPHCKNEGEATTQYKRKTFQGVPSYVFECGKCGNKIAITKKMKKPKKKKTA